MNTEQIRQYFKRHGHILNIAAIGRKVNLDVSNFHKALNGDIGLKPDKQKEITVIIKELGNRK